LLPICVHDAHVTTPRLDVTKRLEIDDALYERAANQCPTYLSTTGFINLILDQGLDTVSRVPAYRVGAEETGSSSTSALSDSSNNTKGGKGVGRESEGNPRKGRSRKPENQQFHYDADESDVPDDLKPVSAELLDFWKHKGGKTTKRAWDGIIRESRKIIDHKDGSIDVIREELNHAAARGQQGIEYTRWIAYKATPKAKPYWQQEPEMKHPAHRDFTAERIAAEKEGNQNFLNF